MTAAPSSSVQLAALARRETVEQQRGAERHPREEQIPEEEQVSRGSCVVSPHDDERATQDRREHERENRRPRLAHGNQAFVHCAVSSSPRILTSPAVVGPRRPAHAADAAPRSRSGR